MAAEKQPESASELTAEQLTKLVGAANAGNATALARLRQILDHNPHIWQAMGDLGAIAKSTLVGAIAGNDNLLMESLQRKATEMRQSLVGPDATPLERLAAERVVIVWLQLQQADIRCARPEGSSIGWAGYWTRVQAQSQRRYESAIRHLQAVQRMQAHKRRRVPAKPSGAAAAESPDPMADRPQRCSSANTCAEHERHASNTSTLAAATSDQATQDDEEARESVIPFARPQPATVSA